MLGGSALVRRRIQTPSVATVSGVVQGPGGSSSELPGPPATDAWVHSLEETERKESPMETTRVGINGFGRIGRNFFRAYLERGGGLEIVAANDIGDTKTMAHLLKHDSVLGTLDLPVEAGDGLVRAGDHEIKFVSVKDPAQLPWGELEIDIAIESTGL